MFEFEIVNMQTKHLNDICELENLCFSVPWSKKMFEGELANTSAYYFVAADSKEKAVAYGGFFCVCGECEITNIAVHPEAQRKHIATQILKRIICEAQRLGGENITLEVRKSNVAAQNLYRKFGFETISQRKRYYRDNGEDAFVMLKKLV